MGDRDVAGLMAEWRLFDGVAGENPGRTFRWGEMPLSSGLASIRHPSQAPRGCVTEACGKAEFRLRRCHFCIRRPALCVLYATISEGV